MGSEKTEIWDRLGKTNPAHTKSFKRAGGFGGTAIKPMESYHRMTMEFGPCGLGWGVGEPTFQVVHVTPEILVYCTVSIWWKDRSNIVYGVGGDKVVSQFSSGIRSDDEAFKKAFTDAVTNALKLIGVAADIHMGKFDDSKYVNEMREEFAEKSEDETTPGDYGPVSDAPIVTRDDSIQVLTVDAQRPIFSELTLELNNCATVEECRRWKVTARSRASRLSESWRKNLDQLYLKHVRELERRDADEYITNGVA